MYYTLQKCTDIFSATFMPHGHCYFWKPEILWPMVLGDAFTVIAYMAIPFVIIRFLQKRPDIKFRFIFGAFSLFIFSCGMVHLLEVINVWQPYYKLTAFMKVLMAIVSVGTVVVLIKEFPNALKIPNVSQLEEVNKQLKAEVQQRREAENKFQNIFDNTFQFIGLIKPDGTVLEVNNTALNFINLKSDDVLGKKFWDTPWWSYSENNRNRLKQAITDAANGEFVRYDTEIGSANGTTNIIDFSIRPLKNEAGEVTLLIPEGRDISKVKALMEELSNARERYETLFSTVKDGIVFQNTDGVIIEANKAAEKILGMSMDEMTGVTSVDPRWKSINEDGSPYPGSEHPPMQALRTGKPYLDKIMGVFQPKLNDTVWIRASGYPIKDKQGNITGAYSTFYDITQEYLVKKSLELSEERFQMAVKGSMAGIWDLDVQKQDSWYSERVYQLLGHQNGEIPSTLEYFSTLVHPLDKEKTFSALENHLKNKTPYRLEIRLKHKADGYRWFLTSGQAMWNDKGEPLRMVGTIIDINERKSAVASLELTTRKLKQKVDELEQFTYIASHDLQEPVRAIESLVILFKETYSDKLDEQSLQYLNHMEKCSFRSQKLVSDLLTYTRIGGRPKEPNTDLNELLNNAIEDLREKIADTHAIINTTQLPKANVIPEDFKLLFGSLLSNSLKFSKPNVNPIITIKYEQKNQQHVISFSDNGIGILEKYFQRIFTVFKRLHLREAYTGTGIGLAYCKKIVDLHDGEINVKSEVGKGTQFVITFPV